MYICVCIIPYVIYILKYIKTTCSMCIMLLAHIIFQGRSFAIRQPTGVLPCVIFYHYILFWLTQYMCKSITEENKISSIFLPGVLESNLFKFLGSCSWCFLHFKRWKLFHTTVSKVWWQGGDNCLCNYFYSVPSWTSNFIKLWHLKFFQLHKYIVVFHGELLQPSGMYALWSYGSRWLTSRQDKCKYYANLNSSNDTIHKSWWIWK